MRSSPTSRTSIRKTSASSRRDRAAAATLAVTLLLSAAPAAAQQLSVVGEVVRHGEQGSRPLAGEWVVLHRVTLGGGAPVDSVRTDQRGRFRLRATADSGAVLLVSARHMGVAYFGPPLHGFRGAVDTLAPIEVYDTTFGRPAIGVRQRHLVVRERSGGVEVLDIVELGNQGTTTRVADTTGPPTWAGRISAGASAFRVGEGDFSPEAVVRRGDSLLLFGPLPPGIRQLSVSYLVPTPLNQFTLRLDQPVSSLALLVETASPVTATALENLGPRDAEGRIYQAFRGRDLPGDLLVRLRVGGGWSALDWAVGLLIAAMIATLGWAALRLRARPTPAPAVAAPAGADALAAEIAALDARYAGGEASVATAEWQRYLSDRAALKARLKDALARE